MQVRPLYSQYGLNRRNVSKDIQHQRGASRCRCAEREREDRAQVILELARLSALDRPVPGVVDSRRHLVGEESIVYREELERQDSHVLEPVHESTGILYRERGDLRRSAGSRSDRSPQYSLAVQVLDRWIEHFPSAGIAYTNHR